jgi:hypothetical protein
MLTCGSSRFAVLDLLTPGLNLLFALKTTRRKYPHRTRQSVTRKRYIDDCSTELVAAGILGLPGAAAAATTFAGQLGADSRAMPPPQPQQQTVRDNSDASRGYGCQQQRDSSQQYHIPLGHRFRIDSRS